MKVQPVKNNYSINMLGSIKPHCRINKVCAGDFCKTAYISDKTQKRSLVSAEQIVQELTNYNKQHNPQGYDFNDPYHKDIIPIIVKANKKFGKETALKLAKFVKKQMTLI